MDQQQNIDQQNMDQRQIIEILRDIQQQMIVIESKIDALNNKSTNVEQDCHEMINHIHFIESTYKIVRTPLNYITNKINYFMNNTSEINELPMIEDQ